ncbi:MAG: hypothetical protein AAB346_05325, partial [Pseudomonadota bacterium]
PAPKPPEPEFPAHAPKGQLLGKPFAVDKAVFSEGALVYVRPRARSSCVFIYRATSGKRRPTRNSSLRMRPARTCRACT